MSSWRRLVSPTCCSMAFRCVWIRTFRRTARRGPGSGQHIYFLNEDFIHFAVSPRADFYLEDFQTPIQQDAMVAKMFWAGNLVINNCQLQGKMSALTG